MPIGGIETNEPEREGWKEGWVARCTESNFGFYYNRGANEIKGLHLNAEILPAN